MAGRANGDAGVAVEKNVAVRVGDPNAAGVVGDEFVIRPRIARRNVLRVGVDDLARLRARQFGFDHRDVVILVSVS